MPLLPSASIRDIEEWILGKSADEYIGRRPGEKSHEVLISENEIGWFHEESFFVVYPSTTQIQIKNLKFNQMYSSYQSPRLTKEEFLAMLGDL